MIFRIIRKPTKTHFGNLGRLLCPDIIRTYVANHKPLTGVRFRNRRGEFQKMSIELVNVPGILANIVLFIVDSKHTKEN